MEKTVKLEQFKKLTEKELQEIQGGDKRLTYFITNLFPKRKKQKTLQGDMMDLLKIFIVILNIFILTNSYKLICRATKKRKFSIHKLDFYTAVRS